MEKVARINDSDSNLNEFDDVYSKNEGLKFTIDELIQSFDSFMEERGNQLLESTKKSKYYRGSIDGRNV